MLETMIWSNTDWVMWNAFLFHVNVFDPDTQDENAITLTPQNLTMLYGDCTIAWA